MRGQGSPYPARLSSFDVSVPIRSLHPLDQELAARNAIRALQGKDIDDVREYVDQRNQKNTSRW
jgi:hypothetical protein